MKPSRWLVMLTMVAAFALGTARQARADGVSCELLEISASSGVPEIPATLSKLAKKLKRPPFTAWNRFALLSSKRQSMTKLVPASISLSKGAAELLVRGVDRSAGKRVRISLGVTMNDAAGRRVVDTRANLDAGDFFAVGYTLQNNDGHLIAISCQ